MLWFLAPVLQCSLSLLHALTLYKKQDNASVQLLALPHWYCNAYVCCSQILMPGPTCERHINVVLGWPWTVHHHWPASVLYWGHRSAVCCDGAEGERPHIWRIRRRRRHWEEDGWLASVYTACHRFTYLAHKHLSPQQSAACPCWATKSYCEM